MPDGDGCHERMSGVVDEVISGLPRKNMPTRIVTPMGPGVEPETATTWRGRPALRFALLCWRGRAQ